MDDQLNTRVTRFLERLTELSRAYGLEIHGFDDGDLILYPFDGEGDGEIWFEWDVETKSYIKAGDKPQRQIHPAPCEGTISRTEVRRIVAEVCRERRENPLD